MEREEMIRMIVGITHYLEYRHDSPQAAIDLYAVKNELKRLWKLEDKMADQSQKIMFSVGESKAYAVYLYASAGWSKTIGEVPGVMQVSPRGTEYWLMIDPRYSPHEVMDNIAEALGYKPGSLYKEVIQDVTTYVAKKSPC